MEANLTWPLVAVLGQALPPFSALPAGPAAHTMPVDTGGARIVEGLRGAPVSGAVGPSQYVQLANGLMAVYDKASGAPLGMPGPPGARLAGRGTHAGTRDCAHASSGAGAIVYDHLAQRWVLAYRSRAGALCVALSDGPDATGRFRALTHALPAHAGAPSLALWRDGVIATVDLAGSATRVCALSRAAGARLDCSDMAHAGVVAASLLPQARVRSGTPALLLALQGDASLALWRYQFGDHAIRRPLTIPVAPFMQPCAGLPACIAQPAGGAPLPALGGALAPLAVFDGQALLVNHTVVGADGRIGLRWYDIRTPPGQARVYQQGTHAPDAEQRWMGSIGIDKAGNIALVYGVSSAATAPGIRYTGRLRSDPPGRMAQEATIVNGSGVQSSARGLGQPGGALSLDPVDGCTFWATHQYIQSSSAAAWQTRIATFKFGRCK